MIQLELNWPNEVPCYQLRQWLRQQILIYGEPLRWAITSILPATSNQPRKLRLEAVVVTSDSV